MESEVLRLKHDILNSLNQLQLLSILIVAINSVYACNATRDSKVKKSVFIRLQLYKSP